MNLILINKLECKCLNDPFEINGSRAEHIKTVHKAETGRRLTVGLLNGNMGTAEVTHIGNESVTLKVLDLNQPPPPPLPLKLIVALPRPKTLKKVIHCAVSMGVKEIIFIESWKVDKSYWKSPVLEQKEIEEQCILALEQAKDTIMPEISFKRRFKPFLEDEVPHLIMGSTPLLAHPYNSASCPHHPEGKITLAVGPEGGWTDYEVELFQKNGFRRISLGERILRVEFAVCALLNKLF